MLMNFWWTFDCCTDSPVSEFKSEERDTEPLLEESTPDWRSMLPALPYQTMFPIEKNWQTNKTNQLKDGDNLINNKFKEEKDEDKLIVSSLVADRAPVLASE